MTKKTYNQTIKARRAVSDIIFAYRQVHSSSHYPMSFRQLSSKINSALNDKHNSISYQTIKNWEDRMHLPRVYTLYKIALLTDGWISEMAHDLLAAVRPEKYEPATFIGKRALMRSLVETGPLKHRYDQHYSGANLIGD